uniref:Uncharacterized protein n=1 Tax=Glossina austeni TaxID=7395 RepID=A0A1A9VTH8_GLOAU
MLRDKNGALPLPPLSLSVCMPSTQTPSINNISKILVNPDQCPERKNELFAVFISFSFSPDQCPGTKNELFAVHYSHFYWYRDYFARYLHWKVFTPGPHLTALYIGSHQPTLNRLLNHLSLTKLG